MLLKLVLKVLKVSNATKLVKFKEVKLLLKPHSKVFRLGRLLKFMELKLLLVHLKIGTLVNASNPVKSEIDDPVTLISVVIAAASAY